jgi:multidrug efflux system outer membrane protein
MEPSMVEARGVRIMENSIDRNPWSRLLAAAAVFILLSGCTLGPEPERPATAADVAPSYAITSEEAAAPDDAPPWWQSFGDPVTAELVEMALANNTDLQVAAARVLEAEATLAKAGGARWPQVGYGLSGSRTKNSFVLPQIGRVQVYSTTYNASLDVSYMLDVFGKLKRSQQAVWASLLAEESARDAVLHGVIAAVVRARVQVATAERANVIASDIRSSWESTLATVERRYRSGLVSAIELYLARENLSSARAGEVGLEGAVEQARHALDVLVGRRAGTGAMPPDTLPELPSLKPVPLGLPIDLLDRRPDLRQAEMRLAASTYGVGVALADLYPSIALTASAGATSDVVGDLISSDSMVYQAILGLVGPLFTGGQRRGEVAASRARVEQAASIYAGRVLQALREVEDALVASQTTRERLEHTQRQVAEARAAHRLSQDRYQRGVGPMLTLLETERRLRRAEEALITTKAALWNARIDLYLALGGDWERSEADEESKAQSQVAVAAASGNPQPSREVS